MYNLGVSKEDLATLYNKSERTISNWIQRYETTGTYERKTADMDGKYRAHHRRWLVAFYADRPLAYLDEAKKAFNEAHDLAISKATVWRIIHDAGLTWKVLERRAMHIKDRNVNPFIQELNMVDWSHAILTFLDEVGFDNMGMLRKRGYALRGQMLAIRGDFRRKPRVSLLAFMGVDGIIEFNHTDGTFDRVKFVDCCKDFVYSKRSNLRMYPGPRSVWILDGASIHGDAPIVHFLRSVGIVPIFLPAYCPFFNPIEFMFGFIKRAFQRDYEESSGNDLLPFIAKTFQNFETYDMSRVFTLFGWKVNGSFDPVAPLEREFRHRPDNETNQEEEGIDEHEFRIPVRERLT